MTADSEYKTVKCPTAKLHTGQEMPMFGLGTWKAAPGEVGAAVKAALVCGYRHIDAASCYKNQAEVGEAFDKIWKEGKVKREDVWVTSKLWNTDHAPADVEKACKKTLSELRLSYLDLYLVHWPATGNKGPQVEPPLQGTWEAMEKLVDQGLVKAIGISNYSATKSAEVLKYARIRPAVNQVECHLYWRQEKLAAHCKKEGILLTAYSPLGSPDSADMMSRKLPVLLEDPTLNKVAKKLGKDPGQVALRWGLQSGFVVIPMSRKPARVESNLHGTLDFELSKADFEELNSLPFQARMLDASWLTSPEGPYKDMEAFWDGEVSEYNKAHAKET